MPRRPAAARARRGRPGAGRGAPAGDGRGGRAPRGGRAGPAASSPRPTPTPARGPTGCARQLDLVAAGAEAVGGLIEVDAGDAGDEVHAPPGRAARGAGPRGRRRGGRPPVLQRRVAGHHGRAPTAPRAACARWRRSRTRRSSGAWRSAASRSCARARCGCVTSGRTDGRARHGLAADLRLDDWAAPAHVPGRRLGPGGAGGAQARDGVGDPAGARGGGHDRPDHRRHRPAASALGLVDELLVVDAASRDGTADVARAHGARVVQESAVLPDAGPCRGKGDAMWRGAGGDGGRPGRLRRRRHRSTSTRRSSPGCSGPLIDDPGVALVKGAFRRPLRAGERGAARRGRPRDRAGRPAPARDPRARAGRASCSRWPASRRRAATCWRRSRSRWATASRRRCCSTRWRCAASTRSPRLTSARARTATSPCASSARWRWRSWAPGLRRGLPARGVGGLRRRADAVTRARRRDRGPRRPARRAPSARRAAPPGGSGRLLGVTALGELLDHLRAERRQVVRLAARHQARRRRGPPRPPSSRRRW